MLYQIVCLSCGYHRAWPTLAAAHADGRDHAEHTAPCAAPALPALLPAREEIERDGSDLRP